MKSLLDLALRAGRKLSCEDRVFKLLDNNDIAVENPKKGNRRFDEKTISQINVLRGKI
jgi:hypothetical protein